MAGKLIQVATTTITPATKTASLELTGINTDDVYLFAFNNLNVEADVTMFMRFTEGGVVNSTANYDYASKNLRSYTSFANESATNLTLAYINSSTATGTGTGETTQTILYLFNFNNSSEYSFLTKEQVTLDLDARLIGGQGGAVYTVAEAHNGIHFFPDAGNIASGTFTLYKVV